MKPADAVRRVRETREAGGDAETTAWACATQLATDDLHRIAALWLVEAARNAERSEVRALERASVQPRAASSEPVTAIVASRNREAIIANVERLHGHEEAEFRRRLIEAACAIDASGRAPRKHTRDRWIWETVIPYGITAAEHEQRMAGDHLRQLQEWAAERVAQMHVDWQRELLEQSFTVNGKRVTWGDATITDHQARADQFLQTAAANAEGAERHMRAVADIEAAGAANLNGVVAALV